METLLYILIAPGTVSVGLLISALFTYFTDKDTVFWRKFWLRKIIINHSNK